jgi:long-chain acyl-CoA synthetase
MIVIHPEGGGLDADLVEQIRLRNRALADFKRIAAYVAWDSEFPRTASMKIKRNLLAEQIRSFRDREKALVDL